ncbi:MAG TPA: plastocyanin/azurin family copper-binding protein [Solirubrobacterales bacterium]|nr:plastocyanin/azurin family copper-binding protein [Solirubrobacterales bacterium]
MRRAVAAVVLAAVLLLLGMAASTTVTPQPLSGTASASECTWERHSKRVVKRVKRHGKVRKVVRRRHWWTCAPIAAAPAPAPPPGATPTPDPEQEPEPEANRLSARAAEFYWVLSRPKVKAGEITVELNNQGEDPHNLNLRREGDEGEPLQIPETDSQELSAASFDLPAGKYRLWCSLPEHEERGMHTTLTVE